MQVAVEDGLVGVDVALPDYKLALFLDGSHQSVSAAQSHLTTLDPDGSMLSGSAFCMFLWCWAMACCHCCRAIVLAVTDNAAGVLSLL